MKTWDLKTGMTNQERTMKKNLFLVAACISIVLPSCIKETDISSHAENSSFVEYSIIAHRESSYGISDNSKEEGTRTEVQSDGQVLWSKNESISLFVGASSTGGYKLTSRNDSPEATTEFYGEIPANHGNTTCWAVYPYRESTTFDDEEVVVDLPYEQVAKKGTFSDDLFISVAKSDSKMFHFRNVCGGVQFTVSTPGIRQVALHSLNDDYMAGKLHIRFDDEDTPYVHSVENGNSSVAVTAPEGEEFEVGTPYYIVCAPIESSDFSVTYRTDTDFAKYETPNAKSIKRSVFAKLLDKDAGLDFKISKATFDFESASSWLTWEPEQRQYVKAISFHVRSNRTMPRGLISTENEFMYSEVCNDTLHVYTGANYFEPLSGEGLFACFYQLETLDLSTFDTSKITSMEQMMSQCNSLKQLDLSGFNTSKVTTMAGMFNDCYSLESIDVSNFDTSNTTNFREMFRHCFRLKELHLPFDLSKAQTIYKMFEDCWNLKELHFSQSSSPVLEDAFTAFMNCIRCNILDLGGLDFSNCDDVVCMLQDLAFKSRNCVIACTEDTKNRILAEDNSFDHNAITWVHPGEEIPPVEDKLYPDLYYSTNYEMDGVIEQVQTSSVGNGIDLYFFGDAYSDRLIASGKYKSDLMLAIDAIFSEEPFKSFRNCFNVYIVYAVSANEVVGYDTAFSTFPDPQTTMIGRWLSPYQYLTFLKRQFISEEVISVTIVNHDSGHGIAYMEWVCDPEVDYGDGNGEALITRCSDDEQFKNSVLHEFGHAFAKLADEYWYDDGVTPSQDELNWLAESQQYGVYTNVSATNDPDEAPWSRFLQDDRYTSAGLGLYEGGWIYATGIWRPTDYSIMRYNTGGYNAPSRAAIYNKIHKRVYGKSWKFDYDEFTEYDQINLVPRINISSNKSSYRDNSLKRVPPVIIKVDSSRY